MPPLDEVDPNAGWTVASTPRKKPGPKPKPLAERKPRRILPIQRPERSYSPEQKAEVLVWLIHGHVIKKGWKRKPTVYDASRHFKIPEGTIRGWRQKREFFLEEHHRKLCPKWPGLEDQVYLSFLERRAQGKVATTSWFRRKAQAIYKELYPDQSSRFPFSTGWWRGFLRRHNIVKRRVTKQSTKRPEDYIDVVNRFLRFIRRISTLRFQSRAITMILNSPKRRFYRRLILNLDETPIPFEYLDGFTWEIRGAKSVSGKSDRSGWNKRQATLILYIFADGEFRLRPTIIFHGTPTDEGGQNYEKEQHLYSPDVDVEFNKTAYNNEELFSSWIDNKLLPLIKDEEEDILLVMDAATFHKTEGIKKKLRDNGISLALIPPGCTSLLQPLDTAINAPFKRWLQEATDEYIEQIEREKGEDFKWSVSDKRVMVTHVVASALKRLSAKSEMVKKAFLNCGISIRPDGAEDWLIRIKDIPSDQIDFTGWEEAEEVIVKDEDPVDPLCDDEEFLVADDDELLLHTQYHEEVIKQLQERLRKRGLRVSGKKADLIQRLRDDDDSQKCREGDTIYIS
ncbi:uncharacterized protein NECHADRAFT_88606 [Fusarium vanettenii 77-13-4]|uniref:SAP domain-containing protein n=1 Tax=Fusarium vanettenii (strain ATCC MYA-4622 / CBS 123669 / FGSC 9596 / NRRL 45880 / 77-13-4) TaxID=660122 RepID=C7ZC01_FUSV7|nr:uncharacterized protein NECHADRAFT_88606 [Fusarium vanettenii 77-13-4]EEU38504.1 hypothetical protein NECHADRAFT_88606 [Fusarium vanettenii 77-13-4]